MAKNYNLQTFSRHFDAAAAASHIQTVGTAVPAGMTRYVTFLRVNPLDLSNDLGSKVFFCSGAVSGPVTLTAASGAQKMTVHIASASTVGNKDVMVPESPSTEHPLFTIASAAYMTVYLASAALLSGSVQVFVQYFEE